MYFRFSKLAKNIIIINVVLTLLIGAYHGYNIHRLNETEEIIATAMEEQNVNRDTAIRRLLNDGEELFLGQEFTTFFGVFATFTTLILLYGYSKTNGFFFGFFAAFSAVFTTFIGGMLLFYLILYGKSEKSGSDDIFSLKTNWEQYIHNKSSRIDSTDHQL